MTSEVLDFGERRFQMWAYSVSHSLLLLRSVKTAVHSNRIDLLFTSVCFIQLPTVCDGLVVKEVSQTAVASLGILARDRDLRGHRCFSVTTGEFQGFVAALAVYKHEDQGEYHEPSPLSEGCVALGTGRPTSG